jgi:hypothetical protein
MPECQLAIGMPTYVTGIAEEKRPSALRGVRSVRNRDGAIREPGLPSEVGAKMSKACDAQRHMLTLKGGQNTVYRWVIRLYCGRYNPVV